MGILRVLLALSVLFFHSFPLFGIGLVGGQSAVQAFYIISGFYMSLILNEKYKQKSYLLFLGNRFLRLFPAYWIVIALIILYSIFIYLINGEHIGFFDIYKDHMADLSVFNLIYLSFANLFMFTQDWVMYMGLNDIGGVFFTSNFYTAKQPLYEFLLVPQAWSIGIELTFYLIAPFIVRKSFCMNLIIFLASITLRILLYFNGFNNDPWTYRFFPTELALFILGNFAYRLYLLIKVKSIPQYLSNIIFVIAILSTLFLYKLGYSSISYIFYYLLIVITIPFIFLRFKNSTFDNRIGDLSYPIYISHLFIIVIIGFIASYFKINISSYAHIIAAITTIIFSIVLIRLIKPIENYRQKRILNN